MDSPETAEAQSKDKEEVEVMTVVNELLKKITASSTPGVKFKDLEVGKLYRTKWGMGKDIVAPGSDPGSVVVGMIEKHTVLLLVSAETRHPMLPQSLAADYCILTFILPDGEISTTCFFNSNIPAFLEPCHNQQ